MPQCYLSFWQLTIRRGVGARGAGYNGLNRFHKPTAEWARGFTCPTATVEKEPIINTRLPSYFLMAYFRVRDLV